MDSAGYYFDRVTDISTPDYIPTVEDVLRTRVRTSGIIGARHPAPRTRMRRP